MVPRSPLGLISGPVFLSTPPLHSPARAESCPLETQAPRPRPQDTPPGPRPRDTALDHAPRPCPWPRGNPRPRPLAGSSSSPTSLPSGTAPPHTHIHLRCLHSTQVSVMSPGKNKPKPVGFHGNPERLSGHLASPQVIASLPVCLPHDLGETRVCAWHQVAYQERFAQRVCVTARAAQRWPWWLPGEGRDLGIN